MVDAHMSHRLACTPAFCVTSSTAFAIAISGSRWVAVRTRGCPLPSARTRAGATNAPGAARRARTAELPCLCGRGVGNPGPEFHLVVAKDSWSVSKGRSTSATTHFQGRRDLMGADGCQTRKPNKTGVSYRFLRRALFPFLRTGRPRESVL